ncbi:MAG: tRNA (adenosine(37)-N6)-threonylcarbamoyltransferase complex ATPase subunit type 1 TsaE [Deferribacterales bacterium]
MTLLINSIDELKKFIINNKNRFYKKKIILNGDLGSGKTTFVKILGEILGFKDIYSPTFTIMNIYKNNSDEMIHCDLYRINSLIELENIGFFDYIDTDNTICIEWGSKLNIENYIDDYIEIFFEKVDEYKRKLTINETRR